VEWQSQRDGSAAQHESWNLFIMEFINVYKNLNCELLGITGRQSEIIELALTYGFAGIDIDIVDLMKRCQRGSFESAFRFINSAKLQVGGFEAPLDLDADDTAYASQLAKLNAVAEIARRSEAAAAILNVPYETDRLPYPEYFEVIRKRVDEVADTFAKEEVSVALTFSAQNQGEQGKQFKFIGDVEAFVALAKSCPTAGIVFDSWNWFCGGGTDEHLNAIGVERVRAARIGDCVEGVAPGAATCSDCLLPGSTGVIDNAGYLRKLAAADLAIPVSAMGRLSESGGTRDAFVAKTQDVLDRTFEQADIPVRTRKPEMFADSSRYASNPA
jgi:hypothetical protein